MNKFTASFRRSDQYKSQQNSPSLSPQPQRRESLVKPTWQNVVPGEVPFETLEKLNELSNGEQNSILQQQQVKLKLMLPKCPYLCVV